MPSIKVSVPHKLTTDEALSRVKKAADSIVASQGHRASKLEGHWEGKTGSYHVVAFGIAASFRLAANSDDVTVTAGLPFFAVPFFGYIKSELKNRLKKILA